MKHYTSPSIKAVGSVRALTQQGGGVNRTDVQFDSEIDLTDPTTFTGPQAGSTPLGS